MYGSFSEEALEQFAQLAAQTQAADFAEDDLYDFTRCVRPDGSAYGTRGKCRKGTEGGPAEKPASRPRAATDSDAKAVVQKMKGAKPRASSNDLKKEWGKAEKAVKAAKGELALVNAATKGDKSPESLRRRLNASMVLDKAERAAVKASDKYFAAAKRESNAAMTPEQRKLEREANKLTKGG